MAGGECPEPGAGDHRLTDRHLSQHRFVGGPQAAGVVHCDDAAPGDHPGESHDAAARRPYG